MRVIALAALAFLQGCVTTKEPARPSFVTDLEPGETDGVLIEWRHCQSTSPCMRGEASGKSYTLGFVDSPSRVRGEVDGQPLELQLDPESVFRLGDHAIELTFRAKGALLAVTWNELDQKLLDHDLVLDANE